jgi:hypothetical protein
MSSFPAQGLEAIRAQNRPAAAIFVEVLKGERSAAKVNPPPTGSAACLRARPPGVKGTASLAAPLAALGARRPLTPGPLRTLWGQESRAGQSPAPSHGGLMPEGCQRRLHPPRGGYRVSEPARTVGPVATMSADGGDTDHLRTPSGTVGTPEGPR